MRLGALIREDLMDNNKGSVVTRSLVLLRNSLCTIIGAMTLLFTISCFSDQCIAIITLYALTVTYAKLNGIDFVDMRYVLYLRYFSR